MSAQKFIKKKAKTGEKKLKTTKVVEKAAEKPKVEEELVPPCGKLKICIIGLGAMGGLIAACLKSKRRLVTAVGTLEHKMAIRSAGLKVQGAKQNILLELDVREEMWEKPDLVVLAVRTREIGEVIDKNRKFMEGAKILTLQNGVKAEQVASLALGEENIISSIVKFGATYLKPGVVRYDFEGDWLIGRPFGPNDDTIKEICEEFAPAFKVTAAENITAMKWLQLIVEAAFCIPAILGKSIPEAFSDPAMAQLGALFLKEGFVAAEDAGLPLESLPDLNLEELKQMIALPVKEAGERFSALMAKLPQQFKDASVSQRLNQDFLEDIDYINGELIRLARFGRTGSVLNTKAASLAKGVNKTGKFLSPSEVTKAYNRELEPE